MNPKDYIDPDTIKDKLPQPYRLIANIINTNIFEGAWEVIRTKSTRSSFYIDKSK